MKETPKQYIPAYTECSHTSALFWWDICQLQILSWWASWIFVDMHDTSHASGVTQFYFRTKQ